MSDALKLPPAPAPARETRTDQRRPSGQDDGPTFDDALATAEDEKAQTKTPAASPSAGTTEKAKPATDTTQEDVAEDAETAAPVAATTGVVLADVPPLPPPPSAGFAAYAIPPTPVVSPPSTPPLDGTPAPIEADTSSPNADPLAAAPPTATASPEPLAASGEPRATRPTETPASKSEREQKPTTTDSPIVASAETPSPTPSNDVSPTDPRLQTMATDRPVRRTEGTIPSAEREIAPVPQTSLIETTDAVSAPRETTAPQRAAPAAAMERPPLSGRISDGARTERLGTMAVRLATLGGGEYRVDLDPPELGRVRIAAEVSEGRVSLSIAADRPDTLNLLRNDVSSLRAALADAGFETGGGDVRFSLSDGGRSGYQGTAERNSRGDRSDDGEEENTAPVLPAERLRIAVDGRVDVSV